MCENRVYRYYYILIDDVYSLEKLITSGEIKRHEEIPLCRLAARVDSYNCFAYLLDKNQVKMHLHYNLVKDIATNMSLRVLRYLIEKTGELFVYQAQDLYRYAYTINNKGIMDFLESVNPSYVRKKSILSYKVRSPLSPECSKIITLRKSWILEEEEYINSAQWLPNEMLEDIILIILQSSDLDLLERILEY